MPERLLADLLDSWDRNNTIVVNLLRAIPKDAMNFAVTAGSPSIAAMFMHMHYCRLVFAHEDAPELVPQPPTGEWRTERDRNRMAEMLNESAAVVRQVVEHKVKAGGEMKLHYDHPILFMQHMIWHEGYHHGQIKLALKIAGRAFDDEEIGNVTWDVWMEKDRTA